MHHFLKPVAMAVLAFAAVGAAQASTLRLDVGTVTPGNGHLVFAVWDGHTAAEGATSYMRGVARIDDVLLSAGIPAPGRFHLSVAPDPLFLDWLRTANRDRIEWGASAIDQFGARRGLETTSQATYLPEVRRMSALDFRSHLGGVAAFYDANSMEGLTPTFSNTTVAGTLAFAGDMAGYGWNQNGVLPFNRQGTLLNNSYDTGLNVVLITGAALGTTPVAYSRLVDEIEVRAWIDFDPTSPTFGHFNVSAVPEPETYAMLLAGLGLMGAIAARRRQRG
jgi:hypothetical protein